MRDNNDIDFGVIILGAVMAIIIVVFVLGYITCHNEKQEELPMLNAEPIIHREITVKDVAGSVPEVIEVIKEPVLSDEDIMAIVVMMEAENQELIGKVAVAATILNRCDYYGLTVESVVNQPNQYSFNKDTIPNEDCYTAVKIALRERDLFPDTMMWFRKFHYHTFATPYMKIQDHYFSYLEGKENEKNRE